MTWALGLALCYMMAEIIGGILSNSLALLADAGHMLTDVAALGVGLFAARMARRPATPQRTYGYHRAEILAALANSASLIAIAIYILVEAYHRFRDPPEVVGVTMLGVALGGLLVNLIMMGLLHSGQEQSLNVRGIWLHVVADAAGSFGTILAATLVWLLGWGWADPLASVFITLLILVSSWRLLSDSVAVLMESTPRRLEPAAIRDRLLSVPGVSEVHDLHVWTITSRFEALTAHVTVDDWPSAATLLPLLRQILHDEFALDHVTVQMEPPGFARCCFSGCDPP